MPMTRRAYIQLLSPFAEPQHEVDCSDVDPFGGYESELTELEDSEEDGDAEEDVDEGDSEDTKHSSEDEDSGSGSDWETGRKHRKKPAKRAKASSSTPSRKSSSGTRKQCSDLLTMPLDVIFEVFSKLAPVDLLSLARANKPLRAFLLSRKVAGPIWRATLRQVPGAPACPVDVSEPHWASLLFGLTCCQVCGTMGVQRVDFGLRRRVCTTCLQNNLVYEGTFKKRFPNYDVALMSYILYTHTGGYAHGHASSSRFFWEGDIHEAAQMLGSLQKAIHMRKPGAKTALDAWKEERKALVDNIRKHAVECTIWLRQKAEERMRDGERLRMARFNAVMQRFVDLGYERSDVQSVYGNKALDAKRELTERIWTRIRPILEPEVKAAQQNRLAARRKALLRTRKSIIEQVYNDYKKSLSPALWGLLPDIEQICQMPDFEMLVNADDGCEVTLADCAAVATALPGYIAMRAEKLKQDVMALLPPSVDATGTNVATSSFSNMDRLYLATTVFRCVSDSCSMPSNSDFSTLVAWAGIISHSQCPRICQHTTYVYNAGDQISADVPRIVFSERGSSAAASLVALLELDPQQTTPQDLDALNRRFVCLNCPEGKCRGVKNGRLALSWRHCVAHYVHPDIEKSHLSPQWMLLKVAAAAKIKNHENHLDRQRRSWSCNLCIAHLDHLVKRSTVHVHLSDVHGNSSPSEGVDYVYAEPWHRPLHQVYGYVHQNTVPTMRALTRAQKAGGVIPERVVKQCRCLHCPSDSVRLFKEDGVLAHLRDKHKLLTVPQLSIDYLN